MNLKDYIIEVNDFPRPGVSFKDITPLLGHGEAFAYAITDLANFAKSVDGEIIVGPESRGFIFGCPVASLLHLGFVPARKKGKLPRRTIETSYDLEYGNDSLHIHFDAIQKGQRVVIIDDLLATGGTLLGLIKLIEGLGGIVVGIAILIELLDLKGREKLTNYPLYSTLKYQGATNNGE